MVVSLPHRCVDEAAACPVCFFPVARVTVGLCEATMVVGALHIRLHLKLGSFPPSRVHLTIWTRDVRDSRHLQSCAHACLRVVEPERLDFVNGQCEWSMRTQLWLEVTFRVWSSECVSHRPLRWVPGNGPSHQGARRATTALTLCRRATVQIRHIQAYDPLSFGWPQCHMQCPAMTVVLRR